MTRIKYHKSGKNYTSNYLTNYEGKRFLVTIHNYPNGKLPYLSHIIDEKGNALERDYHKTAYTAKRAARDLLINKYNVRLNEEIRPRN